MKDQITEDNPPFGYKFPSEVVQDLTTLFEYIRYLESIINKDNQIGFNYYRLNKLKM